MIDNRVSKYMRRNPTKVLCGTPLGQVVEKLSENRIGGAPVVNDQNEVIGFVSERDCLKAMLNYSYHCDKPARVNEVMIKDVVSVFPEDDITDVAIYMMDEKPKIYPVVSNNTLVGIITSTDILVALNQNQNHCGKVSR